MGKYVESIMTSGERLKYETKAHWLVYLPGIITLPLGIGVFVLFAAWLNRRTSEFAVTNRRVIIKTGIISRKTFEMKLDKVEGVMVDQGICGRIFDYGTITITGTGGSSPQFNTIACPMLFKRYVDEFSANAERLNNND